MSEVVDTPALGHRPYERSWARRIVMPLLILVVAGTLLYVGRSHEADQEEEVLSAVIALCEDIARNREGDIMSLSRVNQMQLTEGIATRIAEALDRGLDGFGVVVETGDTMAINGGDGSATHRAYISINNHTSLALRLHHPSDPQRITILGYWIP